MSYAKSIFFIPVWFDDFKNFTAGLAGDKKWKRTEAEKVKPGYLFHYAANIASDSDLFASFSLLEPALLNVYMYEEELQMEAVPIIEEVRFSCFSSGVGFVEFWVTYTDVSPEEIANFAYLFKKAAKRSGRELPDSKQALYDAARGLLPAGSAGKLFFSASAKYKFECNCFHFIHRDEPVPEQAVLENTLHHLCRSYSSKMPAAFECDYDMLYEAGGGDYWCGSTEGMVNLVYDSTNDEGDASHYYLHTIKPTHLQIDYYFLYLLLLNQKYAAVEYIYMVSKALGKTAKEMELFNKRIIQLKTVFSFNVVSDDRVFQSVYAKMYHILEIQSLLADVIENESQMDVLRNVKHTNADRLSSKYLFGISILSLFSALIDAASYFDRIHTVQPISTALSFGCVAIILVLCIIWTINSVK